MTAPAVTTPATTPVTTAGRSYSPTSPTEVGSSTTRRRGAHIPLSPQTCHAKGCEHPECREAVNAYRRDRKRAQARPDAVPTTVLVSVGRVRTHIEDLRAAGIGYRQIAERAQVNLSHLKRIAAGRVRRVKPETRDRLLAVVPVPATGTALVLAAETLDYLGALHAGGWTAARIAEATDLPLSTVASLTVARTTVTLRTAVAIRDLWLVELAPPPELDPAVDPLAEFRLLVSDLGSQAWRIDAECLRLDGDDRARSAVFFPSRGDDVNVPRAVCARCPVRDPCGEFALTADPYDSGVWGGFSGLERRAIRKARRDGPATEGSAT